MKTEPNRYPRIVEGALDNHGPVFAVVDAWGDLVACYDDRSRADFLLNLMWVVGSAEFCYPGPEGTGDPEVDAVRIERLVIDGSGSAESRLEAIDRILGGFGVEHVAGPGDSGTLDYVNAGDTYAGTVGLDDSGDFLVTSWGDWYEGAEAEHAEETGEARCPYCGEWGEPEVADSGDLCSSCGNALN